MIIYSFVGKKMYWFYLKAPAFLTPPPPPPPQTNANLLIFFKKCAQKVYRTGVSVTNQIGAVKNGIKG